MRRTWRIQMRKINVTESLIAQLNNIKGFEDSADEVLAIINTVDNDFTAGYLTAVVEGYTDSMDGDDLIDAVIDFVETLLDNQ